MEASENATDLAPVKARVEDVPNAVAPAIRDRANVSFIFF